MTPEQFYSQTLGKVFEEDGVPSSDPIQCVDYWKHATKLLLGKTWAAGASPNGWYNGYADCYWYSRESSGILNYCDPVTDWTKLKPGDFVMWRHSSRGDTPFKSSHIAMYWEKNGKKMMVGQNQPKKYVTEKEEPSSVWKRMLGAFRFKLWEGSKMELKEGYQEISIGGTAVTAYMSNKPVGLINAGSLKTLDQIDMDRILIYERSCNDLFSKDGTVYGPRVCLNGQIDEPEDSKNYLYYAILKNGSLSFGDWDGKYKDPSGYQCMFSPKAIYAVGKTPKYAPQYGIRALSESVWQAYVAHLKDGSFVKGVSKGPLKAAALWAGLQAYGADSLAIMDGGSGGIGSAQQRYWDGSKAVDAQTSGRAVGDILVFYEPASETEKPADTSESTKGDYQSMYQEKCAELAAMQAKYEALQKTNAENLQTANDLKKKYEEAISKVFDILKGVTAG